MALITFNKENAAIMDDGDGNSPRPKHIAYEKA